MAELNFPKFLSFPSSDELEKLLLNTGKSVDRKEGNNDKHKYFRSLCRYNCTIPSWDQNGKWFSEQYMQSLLDMALMKAIENVGFLRQLWLKTHLFPVAVPDDGQSLFHAVSTAMWGVQDKQRILQQQVENAVPDMACYLNVRWQLHASNVKAEDRQTTWSNIIARLEGKSSIDTSSLKDKEIDSLTIFILANIIHRPIIVINVQSYVSSYSTESVDTEGIFLPLEKPSHDCSKSPIVLCHSDHRFCPLMFMSSANREVAFPLHKGDSSILPVRYGHDDRHAKALIGQYINVKEKEIISETGSTVTLLCSSVSITPLPDHFNSLNIHLKICQEIFQDFVSSKNTKNDDKHKVFVPPVRQDPSNPFQYIDESCQTYVVPLTGIGRKEDSILPLPKPKLSLFLPPHLPLYNSPTSSLSPHFWEVIGRPTSNEMSLVQNITEPERGGVIAEKSKCLTPGCVNERDPGIGELCCSCFTRSTVHESGLELLSLYEGGKKRYVLHQSHLPGTDVAQQQLSTSLPQNGLPVPANRCQAYSGMPSMSLLSVMNESCKGCSNYYCSQKTYPYCHECGKNASREKTSNQNVAYNAHRSNSVQKQSFCDVVFPPPMNVNHAVKSFGTKGDIQSKQCEKVETHIAKSFCQFEGCHNLKQENSNLCFQCHGQRRSPESGVTSPNFQTAGPHHQISSGKTKEPLEFGQAECLSHNSAKDFIEISEAPSLKSDVRKCASPVCETIISSSQMLCEKCQAILISHSHYNRNEHLKGDKNDKENQQTLSAYRAGTFSSIIANSPSCQVSQPQKTQSEKFSAPAPHVGAKTKETSRDLKLIHEREKMTKIDRDRVKRPVPPSPHTSTLTSAISDQNMARAVIQPSLQSASSLSRNVDKDFQRMYRQFTNEHQKGLAKCRSAFCDNYGNKLKSGYCNACFSILSEDERHVAIFGLTERDSC